MLHQCITIIEGAVQWSLQEKNTAYLTVGSMNERQLALRFSNAFGNIDLAKDNDVMQIKNNRKNIEEHNQANRNSEIDIVVCVIEKKSKKQNPNNT